MPGKTSHANIQIRPFIKANVLKTRKKNGGKEATKL